MRVLCGYIDLNTRIYAGIVATLQWSNSKINTVKQLYTWTVGNTQSHQYTMVCSTAQSYSAIYSPNQ